jgi:hypothetical protein
MHKFCVTEILKFDFSEFIFCHSTSRFQNAWSTFLYFKHGVGMNI